MSVLILEGIKTMKNKKGSLYAYQVRRQRQVYRESHKTTNLSPKEPRHPSTETWRRREGSASSYGLLAQIISETLRNRGYRLN